MSITFDPRAIEAKAKAADALTKRRLVRFPRTLHTTDFVMLLVAAIVLGCAVGVVLTAFAINGV